ARRASVTYSHRVAHRLHVSLAALPPGQIQQHELRAEGRGKGEYEDQPHWHVAAPHQSRLHHHAIGSHWSVTACGWRSKWRSSLAPRKDERGTERIGERNGYRGRSWDTRAGDIDGVVAWA